MQYIFEFLPPIPAFHSPSFPYFFVSFPCVPLVFFKPYLRYHHHITFLCFFFRLVTLSFPCYFVDFTCPFPGMSFPSAALSSRFFSHYATFVIFCQLLLATLSFPCYFSDFIVSFPCMSRISVPLSPCLTSDYSIYFYFSFLALLHVTLFRPYFSRYMFPSLNCLSFLPCHLLCSFFQPSPLHIT